MIFKKIYDIKNKKFFIIRALSAFLRFIPQLVIIKLISPKVFGEYSLFITFTVLVTSIGSINLTTGYISKFNKKIDQSKKNKLFLIKLLLGINFFTAPILTCIGLFYKIEFLADFILPIILYIITESTILEYQRFKYASGDYIWLTNNDLIAAISTFISIILSYILFKSPVSDLGFLFLSIKNIIILNYESNLFSKFKLESIQFNPKYLFNTYYYLIKTGIKEIIQLQFFTFVLFVEKILIKKYIGILPLSIFSISSSVMGNISSILLLPNFVRARNIIFTKKKEQIKSFIFNLFIKSSLISTFSIPINAFLISFYLIKDYSLPPLNFILLIGVGSLSSNMSSISAILSPIFALNKEKMKIVFLLSIILITPLIVISLMDNYLTNNINFIIVLLLIFTHSFFQLLCRIYNI